MTRNMLMFRGSLGLSLALCAWWLVTLAMWAAHRTPEHPNIDRQLPTIDYQQPTLDARYVASTLDRTAKRYHLPTCSYVKLMQHGREFKSQEEAEAAGYEPCSRCLPRQIARVK